MEVFITRSKIDDAVAAAREFFAKLKFAQTTPSFFFLPPKARNWQLSAGPTSTKCCLRNGGATLIAPVTATYVDGRLAEGLFAALEKIGRAQRQHFPAEKPLVRDGQSDLEEEG